MSGKDSDKVDSSPRHSDTMNEKKESISIDSQPHRRGVLDVEASNTGKLNAVFENPLAGIASDKLMRDVEDFCEKYDLTDSVDIIKKGARVAQNADRATEVEGLTSEEKDALFNEKAHTLSAATQGMDETANNGAVPIYSTPAIFNLEERPYIQGLVVSAPPLACAVLGCWYTPILLPSFVPGY